MAVGALSAISESSRQINQKASEPVSDRVRLEPGWHSHIIAVRDEFRGRGFGKLLLDHIENHAASKGASSVRLETGIYQPEAVRLYEKNGYCRIPPFRDYPPDDPLSLCYEKGLERIL